MTDSTSFKIGAGLSIVSGILYLFARREYAQADTIKNAKQVKVSNIIVYFDEFVDHLENF
jgi:hypothetical protein